MHDASLQSLLNMMSLSRRARARHCASPFQPGWLHAGCRDYSRNSESKHVRALCYVTNDGTTSPAELIKDEPTALAARQKALEEQLSLQDQEPRPLLHPTMSRRYREEVKSLREALNLETAVDRLIPQVTD